MSMALSTSLGMEERIPLKKDKNRWYRGALMVSIIAKEKLVKRSF